jgi:hypothetical protein
MNSEGIRIYLDKRLGYPTLLHTLTVIFAFKSLNFTTSYLPKINVYE